MQKVNLELIKELAFKQTCFFSKPFFRISGGEGIENHPHKRTPMVFLQSPLRLKKIERQNDES